MNKSTKGKLLRRGISGKGPGSLAWKGGKKTSWNGYSLIYSPDHPLTDSKGYVREHRLVVENHLGRFLLKEEEVHHINGNKLDNRIDNLQVMSRSEHAKLESNGERNPFYGKKHSEVTKQKIREARKKQVGEKHPFFGRKHSEETKRTISETKKRRYLGAFS